MTMTPHGPVEGMAVVVAGVEAIRRGSPIKSKSTLMHSILRQYYNDRGRQIDTVTLQKCDT
jgi:hypothetical protein